MKSFLNSKISVISISITLILILSAFALSEAKTTKPKSKPKPKTTPATPKPASKPPPKATPVELKPVENKPTPQTTVESVIPKVKSAIEPLITQHLSSHQSAVINKLSGQMGLQLLNMIPVGSNAPAMQKAFTDPWGAAQDAESYGYNAVKTLKESGNLSAVIDTLSAVYGKPSAVSGPVNKGNLSTLEGCTAFVESIFDSSSTLRDVGLGSVYKEDKVGWAFQWAETMTQYFEPQSSVSDQNRPYLTNDRAFIAYGFQYTDWSKLSGSFKMLTKLLDKDVLAEFKKTFESAKPVADSVPGVSGDILFARKTVHGWIIIGGKGDNKYQINEPIAYIYDIGGNDSYSGKVASSYNEKQANAVIIDVSGNDSYKGDKFGLATGRTGSAILADLDGNDTYDMQTGSGGVGLMGFGVLYDASGNDTYKGSTMSLGIGFAGIGAVIDLTGNDRYTSDYNSLGLGGPGGVGAVIDISGDDLYQCGHKVPSGYNGLDGSSDPNNPKYQYDAFGMGMGLGRRILTGNTIDISLCLPGGVGMILDAEGNDKYDSSNFSQACGYFFGLGIKLDLAGNDLHSGARYGFASIPHEAMGLFIDYSGKDNYSSTGPTWNLGSSWDHSIAFCIDAGNDDDIYDIVRGDGPALSYGGSWGLFADMGGNDDYKLRGAAKNSEGNNSNIGVFYDGGGIDNYSVGSPVSGKKYEDGAVIQDNKGGLFIDKK